MPAVEEYDLKKKDVDQALPGNEKKSLLNKSSAISTSLNIMFYFILISAILFVTVSGVYSPDGVPRSILGYSIMRVATPSMVPELPVNTLIVTNHVDPDELEVGDVVTFLQEDGDTITHRVYRIYEGHYEDQDGTARRGFRLIGDANHGIPDHAVHPASSFIGLVVASNYSLGRFLMFVHNRFITILILVIAILFLLRVGMSFRERKKKEDILDGNDVVGAEA